MEACKSQQQLHDDGLHQEHCIDVAKESQAALFFHVGK